MNDPFTIRHAEPDDIPELAAFAACSFRHTFGHLYTPENLNAHLDKICSKAYFQNALLKDILLLAYNQQDLIGYAKAGDVELPLDALSVDSKEVHRLYVSKLYQGAGIAHRLMQSLLQEPVLHESPEIYLGVYQYNYRARAFYAKYNFTITGEYTYYVGTHADPEFIMKRGQISINPQFYLPKM